MKKVTLISILILFLACEGVIKPGACTDQFVTSEVSVQNENGDPVSGVSIEVKLKKSGEVLTSCESAQECEFEQGVYTIFNDSLMEKVSKNGEKIIVTGTKGSASFSQEFTFGKNDCHIQKIAGPDTVIISIQN